MSDIREKIEIVHGDTYLGQWVLTDKRISSPDNEYEILLSDILEVEIVDEHKRRGLSGAASGAVLGFLLAGPVGTLVGAGLGAGGKKGLTAYVILNNSKSFITTLSHSAFAHLRACAIESNSNPDNIAQISHETAKAIIKEEKEFNVGEDIIPGREDITPDLPNLDLIITINENSEKYNNDEKIYKFHKGLIQLITIFNNLKWKHFNQLINEKEIKKIIKLIVANATDEFENAEDEIKEETADTLEIANARIKLINTEIDRLTKNKKERKILLLEVIKLYESDIEKSEERLKKLDSEFLPNLEIIKNKYQEAAAFYLQKEELDTKEEVSSYLGYMSLDGRQIFHILQVATILEELGTLNELKMKAIECTGVVDNKKDKIITDDSNAETNNKNPNDHNVDTDDLEYKLEKLLKLKEKGLITEDEFNEKKKSLVDEF